jgi:hypothetical protein
MFPHAPQAGTHAQSSRMKHLRRLRTGTIAQKFIRSAGAGRYSKIYFYEINLYRVIQGCDPFEKEL